MEDFEQALSIWRGLAHPCAPPIGVGEFEVLYASASEVVVWYSPVREGQRAGEVAIPCARLATAWSALTSGTTLDEAALTDLGTGMAGGRWLLALLALLPGAHVQPDPLTLSWSARAATRARRSQAPKAERFTRQPGAAQSPQAPRKRRASAPIEGRVGARAARSRG